MTASNTTEDDSIDNDECVTRDEFLEALDSNGRERMKDRRRIAELEETIEELRDTVETYHERIVELESQLYPELEGKEYGELTREEKVGMVRRHLVQQARARKRMGEPPVAKVTYRDVRADVFDGHPTAHHCYDLMRLAGNGEGYTYAEPSGSKAKYVKFDLRDVDDPLSFVHGNNAEGGEGVR